MSFHGTWECSIATPVGRQDIKLYIRETDGTIAGRAVGVESVPFLDPTLENGHLRWSQKITKPMALTIRFDVTHEGDVLSGTAKPGILPAVKVVGHRLSHEAGE